MDDIDCEIDGAVTEDDDYNVVQIAVGSGSGDLGTWVPLLDVPSASSEAEEVDFLLSTFFPGGSPETYSFRVGEQEAGGGD